MTWSRLFLVSACALDAAWAQRVGAPTDDLSKVSVEELFSVEVSSVGRKAQQLAKAPAAIFVLTAEDIRRTGATSIPEALEWVPGLTVLSLDGRSWAIAARGSARLYSNQLLVMIDGRSLYSPLFGGVIWDAIDVPLEEIEQIEVVRGPGAVMWGPNAANGVINIITKRAQATQGGRVTLASGNKMRGSGEVRWGGAAGARAAYRVWGRSEYRTPAYGSPGYFSVGGMWDREPVLDDLDWATGRLGFRLDAQPADKEQWMLQGDLFKMGRHDALAYPPFASALDRQQAHSGYSGGFIQSRWTHTSATGVENLLQFSLDRVNLNYPFAGGVQSNLNFDFQNRRQTGENNEVYWGAGFQQYWDDSYFHRLIGLNPRSAAYRSGDLVLRDEWQLVPGRLLASAGIRLDYNSYTRLEYQPSLRFLYTPSPRQSAWIAVSRAVKVPSRGDRDMDYNPGAAAVDGFPVETRVSGSHALRSEVERSVEAGYRFQSGQRWSVDLSAFHSTYSRVIVTRTSLIPQFSFSGGVPVLQFSGIDDNLGAGRSFGAEVWGTWRIHPGWRLAPSYSYLMDRSWLPDPIPFTAVSWGRLPQDLRHQGRLRLEHDFSRALQVDLMGRLRSRETTFQSPGVFLIDARLAYRPSHSGELSLSAKNIANRQVVETYSEFAFPAIPVRRTLVIKWSQRF